MQRQSGFVHQDTVPIPRIHEDPFDGVPEPAQQVRELAPVFVDASGRRQRRVRRLGRLLVVPAAVYVALLVSTLLGGPTIHSPLVPLPDAPRPGGPVGAPVDTAVPHRSTHPTASGHATAGAAPRAGATATAAASAARSTAPAATASAVPAATASATAVPTHGRSSHSAAPPGASHRPARNP